MASKPTVTLPNDWIVRSEHYALRVVSGYDRGDNPASRAVSSHGAERNVKLQAHARMAECALCLYFGLDPRVALDWSRHCDPGWDVCAHHVKWDCKATISGKYLIWPLNKRHIFQSKPFDALALVRGSAPDFTMAGFIIKPIFWDEHHIARPGHCLDEGTWYMHESELWKL